MNIQERKADLISSAKNNMNLRDLLELGLIDFLADDVSTFNFLEVACGNLLKNHLEDCCQCDLTDSGYGFCYIAQWYEGDVPSWQIITDQYDYFNEEFRRYLDVRCFADSSVEVKDERLPR